MKLTPRNVIDMAEAWEMLAKARAKQLRQNSASIALEPK
jgi:hypothetical protein